MAQDGVIILVVDDDAGHAELVRRNLRRGGIENRLEAICSGAEALDYVHRQGKHSTRCSADGLLLLLDINMPGQIDGIEVLRRIKSNPTTRHIPVIMLTTADDPREVERCYDLGCNVYITKPIDPIEFSQAIHQLGLILSVARLPGDPATRRSLE
jgi:CheY-like chemotaxis protein